MPRVHKLFEVLAHLRNYSAKSSFYAWLNKRTPMLRYYNDWLQTQISDVQADELLTQLAESLVNEVASHK